MVYMYELMYLCLYLCAISEKYHWNLQYYLVKYNDWKKKILLKTHKSKNLDKMIVIRQLITDLIIIKF